MLSWEKGWRKSKGNVHQQASQRYLYAGQYILDRIELHREDGGIMMRPCV